jgi:hypothetical protein
MKLEDHLYLNKHLLDVEEPGGDMEENIFSKLPRRKKEMGAYWKVAALFILLAGFGALVFPSTEEKEKKTERAFVQTKQKTHPANHNPLANNIRQVTSHKPTPSLLYKKKGNKMDKKDGAGTITKETGHKEVEVNEMALFHKKMNVYSDSLSSLITKIGTIPILVEEPGYYNSFIVAFDKIKDYEESLQQEIRRSRITKSTTKMLLEANEEKLQLLSALQMEVQKANRLIEMNRESSSQTSVSYLNISK